MSGQGMQAGELGNATREEKDLFFRAMTVPEAIREDWLEQQKQQSRILKSPGEPLTLVGDWGAFEAMTGVDSNPPMKRGSGRWQKKFARVCKLIRELYTDAAAAESEPYRVIELEIMSCLVALEMHATQPRYDSTGTALIVAEELEGCAQKVLDTDQRMSRSTPDGSPIH